MRASRLAVALSLVVALGACGDDGSTTTTVEPSPTTVAPTTVAPTTETTSAPTETTTPSTTGPVETTPATSTVPATTLIDVRVYLLRGERLTIVHREVPGPAVLGGALRALLAGPSDEDAANGVATAIPAGTSLRGVNLVDGIATVDLSGQFESGGGSMMMLARITQVVFTATQFDNVEAVRFWLDGEPIEFLGGEGIPLEEPRSRSDTPREFTGGILFDLPEPGSSVTNPFTVTGEGDVFEGDFPLWVRRDGALIGDLVVVRAGAWGEWADFATTLTVEGGPGPIELVTVDQGGCGPPECPTPTEIVLPLVLEE